MRQTAPSSTVLLVDDGATLRDVLSRVLVRDGYTVVTAEGVTKALGGANQERPGLALIDLCLGDGDGAHLSARLHDQYPDLPIILMTAYPIRLQENPGLMTRFRRVLAKPLDLENLRGAANATLHAQPVAFLSGQQTPTEAPAHEPVWAENTTDAATPPPPTFGVRADRWHALKSTVMVTLALLVLAAFLVYVSGVPIPGLSAFGVAIMDGLLLVSYFNQMRAHGLPLRDAIMQGAEKRVRPVMMTALTAIFGLLLRRDCPTKIGAHETQRPLAIVVIGGMITTVILTRYLTPLLYSFYSRRAPPSGSGGMAH